MQILVAPKLTEEDRKLAKEYGLFVIEGDEA